MSLVTLDIHEGVGVVRLDNPPLNLFTRQMTEDLGAALTAIGDDDAIRSVVVVGTGSRAFSAGSDVREFPELMERGSVVEEKLALENAVFDRLAGLAQPTIAAIVGVALGGGAELSLCCDYRIIGSGGSIGFPEIRLGTVPGSGGLSRLPRLVGPSRALGLFLGGQAIEAAEAFAIGLVDEVVDPAACLERAAELAAQWASRGGVAVRAIKAGVLQASRDEITAEMASTLDVSRTIFGTQDMREGVAAFLAKRTPTFRHR